MALVDTHHHFVPDFYAQAVEEAGGDPSGWPTPSWSLEGSIAFNERVGTTKTILSLTAPGAIIAPTDEKRRALARKSNEFAAAKRDEEPDRWGFFAALPCLLDTEGALTEIIYSLEVLKADGVTLFTRYGAGNQYLGDAAFKPIWEELDSRKAVVFIHPTHAADTTRVNPLLPQPAIDYPHETTRTAVDMIITNTKRTYSSCKVILSHAGGTLPFLITRISTVSREAAPTARIYGKTSEEIMEDFRSFYFDFALSSSEAVLRLVLDVIPHDRLLYGSDYPYASPDKSLGFKQILDDFPLEQELRDKIYFKNAIDLLG
ncbi:amidohydrolase family protein [Penicillium angulare]|uniref:amidohydrolase family protein n=1 Tax=Penicillium angulare TaxID=116970 RepID=UPI0025401F33|nr:amidohydrolase family protein [Penicillium angulare]KAJ5287022.1 amidohydrolase family protein [Penicillium angulare]